MFRFTRLLLMLLVTYEVFVQAADLPSVISREEEPSSSVDGSSKRTLFNIIWGCVSTIIISASHAIHPNIQYREGCFKGTLRTAELLFWTIVAPEILPAWALSERLAAIAVRDVYNREKGYETESRGIWKTLKGWFLCFEFEAPLAWTLRHGHLLIMGGFHLVEPVEENSTSLEAITGADQAASDDVVNVQAANTPVVQGMKADAEKGHAPLGEGRVTILTLGILYEVVKDPEFVIRIREDEIADRSKGGDTLSKIILILQSSWFGFQCIARGAQGLGLTQLEMTTLAFAGLNLITYILWWDKPLGMRAPVRIYLKRKLTDKERNVEGRFDRKFLIFEGIEAAAAAIRNIVLWRLEATSFVAWLVRPPLFIAAILLSPIIMSAYAFSHIINKLMGMSTLPTDATYIPNFYVQRQHYDYLRLLYLMALGAVFGAIHCAGWNLIFPTYTEQQLWRVASLTVTIIPIAPLPFYLTVRSLDYGAFLGEVLIIISMLALSCARVVLIGLAVAVLRHQPPSAFTAIDWTKFYPHF